MDGRKDIAGGSEAELASGLWLMVCHKAMGVECLGNSKESFFLVSIGYYRLLWVTMGYYELLTVTIGYQIGNLRQGELRMQRSRQYHR